MKVTFCRGQFTTRVTFQERDIPKKAGWTYRGHGVFETPSPKLAARLRDHFDHDAEKEISRRLLVRTPWTGDLQIKPGLSLYPFQKDAARFALERNRSYLGLDPGLGKTIVAVTLANTLGLPRVIYICPPFLTLNVETEFVEWSTSEMPRVSILGRDKKFGRVTLVPDSRLNDTKTLELIRRQADLARFGNVPFVLFVDESHRFNSLESARSQVLYRHILPHFDKVVFLSGTPLQNRPHDLYPVLSHAAPETIDFASEHDFGIKYCAGRRDKFGFNYKGASNVKELARRIKGPFLLRIRKEVLDLPPKREEMVFIGDKVPAVVRDLDAQILREYSPSDLLKGVMSPHISTYRKNLGALKVPDSLPYIRAILDDTDENIIVAAYHQEVVAALAEALAAYDPLFIVGPNRINPALSVPAAKRLGVAQEFQRNKKKRLVLMSLKAGGIGLNLTKADRVINVEPSWVPADNDQLNDRAHRIGRKGFVFCVYMVYRNSCDRKVLETCFRKQAVAANL